MPVGKRSPNAPALKACLLPLACVEGLPADDQIHQPFYPARWFQEVALCKLVNLTGSSNISQRRLNCPDAFMSLSLGTWRHVVGSLREEEAAMLTVARALPFFPLFSPSQPHRSAPIKVF